jgi:sugar O-acyltransferase (sialic acid O-acetyltransferase NeuD family)
MLIYGTGGHALEILDELNSVNEHDICFYNDIDLGITEFYGFKVLKSIPEVIAQLGAGFEFVIAIGNPVWRKQRQLDLCAAGGIPRSVFSSHTILGKYNVQLGKGLNVMAGVNISSEVSVGDGCLINRNVNIHHHVGIGDFCEIAPNAVLLGNAKVENETFIGSGAVILPGIKIGSNCVVGAGAIVTSNVKNNSIVKGNPAK